MSGQPETKDINVLEDSLNLNIVKMIIILVVEMNKVLQQLLNYQTIMEKC